MYYVTPKQMKDLEQYAAEHKKDGYTLMVSAGTAMAERIAGLNLDLSKGVVLLCGSGNNGGDGFVCARLLAEMGVPAYAVLMTGEPVTEAAMRAYMDLGGSSAEVLNLNDNIDKIFTKISAAVLVVDAAFGTGFHGELPPQVKACLSFANRSPCKKLAADLPSGGNAETGAVAENTLKCDYTITFANPKLGMALLPLKDYLGKLEVVDIGIPKEAYSKLEYPVLKMEREQAEAVLPHRAPDAHKGDFGKLVCFCGSRRMPGAAGLVAKAALRAGAGLVTLATVKTVAESLSSSILECTYLPLKENARGEAAATNGKELLSLCEEASAVVIGPGLGVSEDVSSLVDLLLSHLTCPVVLDADGINCAASHIDMIQNTKAALILTPHPGEMARLLKIQVKDVLAQRFAYAIKLASELGVTVVAKGAPTLVAGGHGFCCLNTTGNPGLARGGSGDVLSGIIGSLAAQGIPPDDAAAAGVYLHGAAADGAAEKLSMQGMLPSDVIEELPFVFKQSHY